MIYQFPFINILNCFISLFLLSCTVSFSALAESTTSIYQDEVYEKNPRSGAFQQVTRTFKLMATEGLTSKSTRVKPVLIQDLGAVETCQLSLFRKGEMAELQFYCMPSDIGQLPTIQKRNLTLTQGTWSDFENGKLVQAQMVDDDARIAGYKELALTVQKFLNRELLASSERAPSQLTHPEAVVAVRSVFVPKVELHGSQIKITYSAK